MSSRKEGDKEKQEMAHYFLEYLRGELGLQPSQQQVVETKEAVVTTSGGEGAAAQDKVAEQGS